MVKKRKDCEMKVDREGTLIWFLNEHKKAGWAYTPDGRKLRFIQRRYQPEPMIYSCLSEQAWEEW